MEFDDGWYMGVIQNDLPNGFGRKLFKDRVNKHPPNGEQNMYTPLNLHFLLYDGNFKYGYMHGQGTLLCEKETIYIGEFQKDQFHGLGSMIGQNMDGTAIICIG